MKKLIFVLLLLSCNEYVPRRELGVSVRYMPEKLSLADTTVAINWGFFLKTPQSQSTYKSAQTLINYYFGQDIHTKRNGIWVLTTRQDAHSEEDLQRIIDLKNECILKEIPLFFCRGSELPHGWIRISEGTFDHW